MVIENITGIPILDPLIIYMTQAWNTIKVMLGGLFGIYVIAIGLRFLEYKKIRKELRSVKYDLGKIREQLEKKKVIKKGKKKK